MMREVEIVGSEVITKKKGDGGYHCFMLTCALCDKSIEGSYKVYWREKFGRPVNVAFIHYKCTETFEAHYPGKWFTRGWPGISVRLPRK